MRSAADEPEPTMAEFDQVIDGRGRSPPRLSTLTVSTPGSGCALPQSDDGNGGGGEVVEQPRLVAHVAEAR